jgi:hypothetical protein
MRYNMKRWIMPAMILAIMLVAIIGTSSAATNLAVTSNNLNTLNSFTNSGAWYNSGANSYLLKWYGGGQYFEPTYKAPAVYHGIITATIMADYGGNLWGECVSMVKNLAHSSSGAASWYRGNRVVDGGVSPGTVVARFSWSPTKGRYVYVDGNHATIFRQYIKDSSGKITGMMVWDQNWYKNEKGQGIVAMHIISKTGSSSVSDANTYYVVQV